MTHKKVDRYGKHGCYFSGKLLVIDYTDDMKQDTILNCIERAKNFARENYDVCEILLTIPEFVCRLN